MINYYKQMLEQGCYIAEHGRWEAAAGTNYSPGSIGGYSFMSKEGFVLYEMTQVQFNELMSSMELFGYEWGDRSSGKGGGIEYRTKEWHELELKQIKDKQDEE